MASLRIDFLNPNAGKLLKNLADLNLIAIKEDKNDDGFLRTIRKIRVKAKTNTPSFEDITKEVEAVRAKRYTKAKR